MNICQEKLLEFHKKFKCTIRDYPGFPDTQTMKLRDNLIKEEAEEFHVATETNDLIEIGDAIADLLYVVFGAAVSYGLDAQKLFDEVHRSNMTKVWEDGTIHRRPSDNKIVKPPTYSPANIKGIIEGTK